MRVFLVRHGQSAQNTEDLTRRIGVDEFRALLLASNTSHLTPLGIEQAHQTAVELADYGVTHLYASPYDRAQHTAQIISTHVGLPVTTIDDLHEINALVPWVLRRRRSRPLKSLYIRGYLNQLVPHTPANDGETWWSARRRIVGAWQTMLAQWRPSSVSVIVAHHGVNWLLVRYLERHGGWRIVRRSLENGGISEIEQV